MPVSPPSVERLATGRPQGVRAKIFLTRWGESSEAIYRDYVDFLFKWGVIKQKIETADLTTDELVAEANALDAAEIAAAAKAYKYTR